MLSDSDLSKTYREDAIQAAVYLKNKSPHRALVKCRILLEKWFECFPDRNNLKVIFLFWDKLEEVIFVGYTEDPHGYYFKDPGCPRRLKKSRDVNFFEECFSNLKKCTSNFDNDSESKPVILFDRNNEGHLTRPTISTDYFGKRSWRLN